jgi:acyl dehydratase
VTADERRFAPVTRTDLVRYAGVSGDFHPLHHDEQFCRAAGFPSSFAMGMCSAGLIGSWAADRIGPGAADRIGPGAIRRFRVRFKQQVWPGDELVVSGSREPGSDTFEII